MEVREIKAEETYPLRARVLRPGQPLEASQYPGDGLGLHLGVVEGGEVLSTVSAYPENNPLFPEEGQWRIRGMATAPEHQGKRYGRALIRKLLSLGREKHIPLFWCNARERALPFYLREGFTAESELFEVPSIGPHKILRIKL
jgi:GNAT superfamily N-acetyltransferase